jgi:uncharacterized protein YjlB
MSLRESSLLSIAGEDVPTGLTKGTSADLRSLEAHGDLSVVGAYPAGQERWDLRRAIAVEHKTAVAQIAKAPIPRQDPDFGLEGRLLTLWR